MLPRQVLRLTLGHLLTKSGGRCIPYPPLRFNQLVQVDRANARHILLQVDSFVPAAS